MWSFGTILLAFCMHIEASAIHFNYGHSLSDIPISQYYGDHTGHGLGSLLHIPRSHLPPDVIRITKTVAVNIPRPVYIPVPHNIPYPVKVEVPRPYPVEVAKVITVKEQIPIPVHHVQQPHQYEHHQHQQQQQQHTAAGEASIAPVQTIPFQPQDAVQIQAQHDGGESDVGQSAYAESGYHS